MDHTPQRQVEFPNTT